MRRDDSVIGSRYGKLTVLEDVKSDRHGNRKVKCICDCGKVKQIRLSSLKSGDTKSCGCLASKEKSDEVYKKHIGKKYGRLTVLNYIGRNAAGKPLFMCICECGKQTKTDYYSLQSGTTKSCGCFYKEKVGKATQKHGESRTRLYNIWIHMRNRCGKPKADNYKYYGARGICVCDEWKNSYETFRNWALANGYKENLTIDRIDVDGNYEPSNCRWTTVAEQNANKRPRKRTEV